MGRSPSATVRGEVPWLAGLLAVWAGSRLWYGLAYGAHFDPSPLGWYLQFVDPALLRTRLLESVFWLRDQPPGFNLFLGIVLKGAGQHADAAFHGIYRLLGAALVLGLWFLMRRLDVRRPVAFVLAALFATSPVGMLYESWLFYTYPVTVLLCLSALLLHRFVELGRTVDGAALFALLAAVVLTRGTFHIAWFGMILAGVVLAARRVPRRRLATAAAVPAALLLALYVKNYAVFGEWFAGRVYRDLNYAEMVLRHVPAEERDRLVARGELSPIVRLSIYQEDLAVYDPFLGEVEETGIPVLDTERKSTGQPNWQSLRMQRVGRRMAEAAEVAALRFPDARSSAVRTNLTRYFVPADRSFPFDAFDLNARALAGPLAARRRLAGQRTPDGPAVLYLVALPALLVFACGFLWASARRGQLTGPDAVTVAFMLFTIVYLATVTILFSAGDHNRYRFKVAPFYLALAGLAISTALDRLAKRRGRAAVRGGAAGP